MPLLTAQIQKILELSAKYSLDDPKFREEINKLTLSADVDSFFELMSEFIERCPYISELQTEILLDDLETLQELLLRNKGREEEDDNLESACEELIRDIDSNIDYEFKYGTDEIPEDVLTDIPFETLKKLIEEIIKETYGTLLNNLSLSRQNCLSLQLENNISRLANNYPKNI